jgi:protein tyrosine/serine phosphatase
MHCKSGADRAGMASALYLLDQGSTVAAARDELSFKYLHLRFTKTGVQDHMLDLFEARQTKGKIQIRDWLFNEYSPDALAESFAKLKRLPL